jgi:ubiquitin-protein ligase E3 C
MSFHTFTGSSRRPRQVNLSGRVNTNPFATVGSTGPPSAVATAQQERERRQRERQTVAATNVVQRYWRGYRSRRECFRKWRQEWDQVEATGTSKTNSSAPYTSSEEAYSQLKLLLRFASARNTEDVARLQRYLSRQYAAVERQPALFSGANWPLAYLQLQRLILKVMESIMTNKGGLAEDGWIFKGLAMTIDRIPDLTARNARPIYQALRHLIQQLSSKGHSADGFVQFILQAALPPLKSITANVQAAYEAFGWELLTLEELTKPPLFESLLKPLADGINYKLLSHSLAMTLKGLSSDHITTRISRRSKSILLGCLIYFHRWAHQFQSVFSYASDKDYLYVVSELLSAVATNSTSDDDEENPFVTEQITSLINSDSLGSFIPSDTVNSSSPDGSFVLDEEAKQISSFALTLLRYFPRKSEDIRIKLYMASTNNTELAQEKIPAMRFFWQSTKSSKLIDAISKSTDAVIPLIKANERDGSLAKFVDQNGGATYNQGDCQNDWRVVLLFLELYSFAMKIMDDEEFFSSASIQDPQSTLSWASRNALPLADVGELVLFLKNLSYSLYFNSAKISVVEAYSRDSGSLGSYFSVSHSTEPTIIEKAPEATVANMPGIAIDYVKNLVTGVLRMLYERDSRRQFLPKGSWLMMSEFDMDTFIPAVVEEEEKRHRIQEEEEEEEEEEEAHEEEDDEGLLVGTSHGARIRHAERLRRRQRRLARSRQLQAVAPRLAILQNMPFFIPFETRVQIFREFIKLDQVSSFLFLRYSIIDEIIVKSKRNI